MAAILNNDEVAQELNSLRSELEMCTARWLNVCDAVSRVRTSTPSPTDMDVTHASPSPMVSNFSPFFIEANISDVERILGINTHSHAQFSPISPAPVHSTEIGAPLIAPKTCEMACQTDSQPRTESLPEVQLIPNPSNSVAFETLRGDFPILGELLTRPWDGPEATIAQDLKTLLQLDVLRKENELMREAIVAGSTDELRRLRHEIAKLKEENEKLRAEKIIEAMRQERLKVETHKTFNDLHDARLLYSRKCDELEARENHLYSQLRESQRAESVLAIICRNMDGAAGLKGVMRDQTSLYSVWAGSMVKVLHNLRPIDLQLINKVLGNPLRLENPSIETMDNKVMRLYNNLDTAYTAHQSGIIMDLFEANMAIERIDDDYDEESERENHDMQ
jgi:hypothetical protein